MRDRPVDEIESTEEMVEAGSDVFYGVQGLLIGDSRSAAHEIFTAMVSAQPKRPDA